MKKTWIATGAGFAGLALIALGLWTTHAPTNAETRSVIVQAKQGTTPIAAVQAVGGRITHELGIIHAVGADLTESQIQDLLERDDIRIHDNSTARIAGKPQSYTATLVGADRAHEAGITGAGVTIAVLDTGIWDHKYLKKTLLKEDRILGSYNAIEDKEDDSSKAHKVKDENGHGTHVASVAVNSERGRDEKFNGVAPGANLVVVQGFDEDGIGSYLDVIRGLGWIVDHREELGIRVLNLSFSGSPRSHYWEDPLNQAVMAVWQAGIVVVASAGNRGPSPMTIGVPGNVPYIITVGAMSDSFTPDDPGDDYLASFSAAGPTYEGFLKPEIVAPGGHVTGLMDKHAKLSKKHKKWHDGKAYFWMSGTSQAAAVVSGVAALLLEAEPALTPDEVKYRLLSSARPAVDAEGERGYSIFQQGAGLVSAYDAIFNPVEGFANQSLDIDNDLAGIEHYGGPANLDEDGNFYIMGESADGYLWDGSYGWSDAYLWSNAYLWSDAYLWSNAYLWSDAYLWADAYLWSDAYLWARAYLWSSDLSEKVTTNRWVPQE